MLLRPIYSGGLEASNEIIAKDILIFRGNDNLKISSNPSLKRGELLLL